MLLDVSTFHLQGPFEYITPAEKKWGCASAAVVEASIDIILFSFSFSLNGRVKEMEHSCSDSGTCEIQKMSCWW
jgi:hypothetical protein